MTATSSGVRKSVRAGRSAAASGVPPLVATKATSYVAIANNFRKPYTLVSGQQTTAGSWSALDGATGKILWQTADPTGGIDPGSVTVANGVVYAGSLDAIGHMYALDAATGEVRWSFASGGSVNGGPTVVNGTVYWGSGYRRRSLGTGNNKVYAFSLPSR
jgi:polyvinyl alcohol dehydrogenase (cytochrome)